jgi:hypothetical protein
MTKRDLLVTCFAMATFLVSSLEGYKHKILWCLNITKLSCVLQIIDSQTTCIPRTLAK